MLAVYGRDRMQSLCKPGVHIGDKVCNISLTVEVQIEEVLCHGFEASDSKSETQSNSTF